MPAQSLAPLFLPVAAVALNLVVLLFCARLRFTVPRAALRGLAFAALTVAMLHAQLTPTQTPDLGASAEYRFARGAVQIVWWLLAASTTTAVVRLYYTVNDRTREERFTLDVVETVLYLTALVAIVTDVFDIPLKGVLATSGALAIVLGLALQSTLADLFSGFVINATAPYRVGDRIVLDDGSEGSVREVTWRATHVLKGNHDLIVVPNSVIAKSKVVNASMPAGAHATVVRFQALPAYRPSLVVSALRLAIDSCVGIDAALPTNVVTKSVGWQASDYEVSFFVASGRSSDDTLNTFFDAAHRHLEALSLFDDAALSGERPVGRRLIDGIGIFGLLSRDEKEQLASLLKVRELAPGEILLRAGEVPAAITLVGYGVINATSRHQGVAVDVMRFSPCEYLGEGGPIAGVAIAAEVSAKTYAIVYELPGIAIAALLKRHPELTHVLAAKLAERERCGQALMEPAGTMPTTPHGLAAWIARGMQALHGLHF
ncbi:mechanosensitive ion channel family protein [Paraburkholderia xenovorans]|uniref:mechanosensitive ion channel domain-containing protein n=1 Tax=Paraburkholderia xenovorans TaxID=36873 RepID=UPI0038BC6FD6